MTDQAQHHPTARRNKAGWYPLLLGLLLVALGLVIGAGGVWLIALGGSWYYAIAGLGLEAAVGVAVGLAVLAVVTLGRRLLRR